MAAATRGEAEAVTRERWPSLPALIDARMAARGLTVREAAERVGVPTSTFQSWRVGKQPPLKYARRLARALGVSLRALAEAAEG
ncbi:MAG TPA: helix-turn-helix transcriptional regulator [Anaeromyxobacteraceae bacterium]|nr:helix-turn-helix transcriptional regulator [Anaeromyxobacteraceae bacterium]